MSSVRPSGDLSGRILDPVVAIADEIRRGSINLRTNDGRLGAQQQIMPSRVPNSERRPRYPLENVKSKEFTRCSAWMRNPVIIKTLSFQLDKRTYVDVVFKTYKTPVDKVQEMPSALLRVICSLQISGGGIIRITTSRRAPAISRTT